MKHGKLIYYYTKIGFDQDIIWIELPERYRNVETLEKYSTHPITPDNVPDDNYQTPVWLYNMLVLKNEAERYYFSRSGSNNGDIM